ncbi:MAG: BsuPI-related putative proteinase inhibitor [Planctomycetota bacterium]|jgi:hypothetical protein
MKHAFRRVTGLAVLAAALIMPLTASAQQTTAAHEMFPLEYGNEWNYSNGQDTHRVGVDYQWMDNYFWVDGIQKEAFWVYENRTNLLYRPWTFAYSFDHGQWFPLFLFDRRGPWTYDITANACDTLGVHRQDDGLTVTTPAGTFRDVVRFAYTQQPEPWARCTKPFMTDVFFAPGVGPVRFLASDGTTYDLETATVGAVAYPTAPQTSPLSDSVRSGDLEVTVEIDRLRFENKPNTIRCITQPCPSNAVIDSAALQIHLTNHGSQTQTYRFASGRQFEIELVDKATGRVAGSWSGRMFFTMAFTGFNVAPGETKTFAAPFELTDDQGAQLYGDFTIRAYVIDASVAPLRPELDISVSQGQNP